VKNIIYGLLSNLIFKIFLRKSQGARRTKNKSSYNNKNSWLTTFLYGLLGGIIITMLIIIIFNYGKITPKLPNKKLHSFSKSFLKNTKENNQKPKLTTNNTVNNYDFYNLLPNTPVSPVSSTTNVTINNKPTKPSQYFLQIGTFRKIEEADELKAKLALHGFEANIETVTLINKNINYKVLLGPFASQSIVTEKKEQVDLAGFKNTTIKII